MPRLRAILAEAFGLVVDDGRLAIAAIVWLLFCWLALPWLCVGATWRGGLLFAGLAAILIESVLRRAGTRSGGKPLA